MFLTVKLKYGPLFHSTEIEKKLQAQNNYIY